MDGNALGSFALLDDCLAQEARQQASSLQPSRLYTGFVRQYICDDPQQLDTVVAAINTDLAGGLHAVVLAGYEFGAALQQVHATPCANSGVLRCLLFSSCQRLDRAAVSAWLTERAAAEGDAAAPAGIADLAASLTRSQFDAALAAIRDALAAGEVYQVNYTYQLRFKVFGSPYALYHRLRARQPVPFGALIALPDDNWIVSLSPELFIAHRNGQLVARPMKGTAPRLPASPDADARAAQWLRASPKSRAENLMIVDLLRNDFGRIARTGSVRVPALFDVEPYPSVWQMTSTVKAMLDPAYSFADLLRAAFPCGSITGAPKRRAMQLIAALETAPRGLYTGAIGWLEAPSTPCGGDSASRIGDFALSVAIRTLELSAPCPHPLKLREGCLGVGGGIVSDSETQSEWEEAQLKARFLTGMDPGFALLETMFATRAAGVRHLNRHLARLRESARRLLFAFDCATETALRAALDAAAASLPDDGAYRFRLTLPKSGAFDLTVAPLATLPQPVELRWASACGFAPTDASDFLLRHKTTHRARYDKAWRAAEQRGAFDLLFANQKGELTEGARSNLFIKRDGRWWTPPVASGALPGVMRGVLLDDPAWQAAERVLTAADLRDAEALAVCNALRGVLTARLSD